MPVHALAGGPHRDRLPCYATGNDVDWYQELGFRAFKLACPHGPADGLDGLRRNEEFVARTRERIGDDCELMLDCWMAFDIEYTVRLAETLRPYRLKWIEEVLVPDDHDAHVAVRERLPWQTLATGEHWYTALPFQWAVNHHVVDILQPDIAWVGGFSTCEAIAATAAAANVSVILHGGGNTDFLNMLERDRLESKKISKTNAVTSQLDYPVAPENVHVGPSDHVPWLQDRKWAQIRLEGTTFGDVPLSVEMKLEVWDSPNSAGVVIDAIRCAKLALNNGIGGTLLAPSSYFMKSPPEQYHDDVARDRVEEFIDVYRYDRREASSAVPQEAAGMALTDEA
jgi:hypothetical protein